MSGGDEKDIFLGLKNVFKKTRKVKNQTSYKKCLLELI